MRLTEELNEMMYVVGDTDNTVSQVVSRCLLLFWNVKDELPVSVSVFKSAQTCPLVYPEIHIQSKSEVVSTFNSHAFKNVQFQVNAPMLFMGRTLCCNIISRLFFLELILVCFIMMLYHLESLEHQFANPFSY